jgi:hypothetical protein
MSGVRDDAVSAESQMIAVPPNWFHRNWIWVVSVASALGLAVFGGFVFAVFLFVMRMMHSFGAYQEAMTRARQDPALIAAIGTPIEEGLWVSGKISENNQTGRADLTIPLSGPQGRATLHLRASKSGGAWKFSDLRAKVDATNQRIDLLNETR